ncbi:negative elongation factor E-like [Dendronephthya gigantea]|uniref:negative elongation factor E-like n=1 Tax=Dendronephthya gigantea TaxID=151771 RepID=UPI00106C2B2C|nr:negative elongation factor E-like [Dendronephthya gigantea]XP_028393064.1 negative elongation factor E-like [Dendronephthya gigantea]XP_028393065.1 negative elongation factor E-like [Dendronephthya gigantea]
MSSFSGGPLTEEEEYLLERFKVLREKKKLLQKLKEKAETKVKPAVKRELAPTASITPEDAKKKAEMLVASGCVKISKTSVSREFKRVRTSEKKLAKDSLSDQELAPVEKKRTHSDISAMKEMYNSNFVKSRENRDHDSNPNHGYRDYNRGYREPRKGNTVFIKGYGLTEEIVKKEFGKYGTVTDVHFERDRKFGFVTYKSVDEAQKTIDEMNGEKVGGVFVQVSFARRQFHNDRGDSPMWARDHRPRDRSEKPSQDNRELQRYGDGDDFF